MPTSDSYIIKYLSRILTFKSATEKLEIERLFTRLKIGKKTNLFLNGDSNVNHYFIEKGLLRLYVIDSNGKDFNILFGKEWQVLGDLASPAPTLFNLEAIEDSVVYSISDENLKRVFTEQSARASLETIKRSYIFLQKRLVNILTKTAEENYIEFSETYPELNQRLPQYHIASYLGVSAEFLSKIIARTTRT